MDYISLVHSGCLLITLCLLAPAWPWADQTWASRSPSSCAARGWWAGTCSSWSRAPASPGLAAPSEVWWWRVLCLVKRTHYSSSCPLCSLVCQVCWAQLYPGDRVWREARRRAWQSPGSGSRAPGWTPAPAPAGCRGWPPAHWPPPASPPPSPRSWWSWSRSGNSGWRTRSGAWRGRRPLWKCRRGGAAQRPALGPPHSGASGLKWSQCHKESIHRVWVQWRYHQMLSLYGFIKLLLTLIQLAITWLPLESPGWWPGSADHEAESRCSGVAGVSRILSPGPGASE